MTRDIVDSMAKEKLNIAICALDDMISEGKTDSAIIEIMKSQVKQRIREIHKLGIYKNKKTHIVNGKEVPISWYTKHPDDHSKKLTAPTEDALYRKLADIYTGRGIDIMEKGKQIESPHSLRNLFNTYINSDKTGLATSSVHETQRLWDSYLDDKDIASKDIHDITATDLMNTFSTIATNGMKKNGASFHYKYFESIKACVGNVYKYARTFVDASIIDYPQTLDISMLPLVKEDTKNDDIKAEALSPAELARAIEWCRQRCENQEELPILGLWFNFSLGLRFAELYALRWCDVNSKLVKVNGQMDKDGHSREENTKKYTDEGKRNIPLTKEAAEIWEKILAFKPEDAKDDDLIFPLGGYSTYRRRCKECFKYALNVTVLPKHYVPHTLRSTNATACYSGGMNVKELQGNLGHKNLDMTLRYTKDKQPDKVKREHMETSFANYLTQAKEEDN